ncbi:MAG: tetratricopeptide repeat protein, partial [Betaproteobacteria bacterium]
MTETALLERGRRALLAGDFAGACSAFEVALKLSPADAECWFLLGAARHQQLELSKARAAFLQAIALDPFNIQSYLALAAVCLALGDVTAAGSASQEATKLSPDDPGVWHALGVAHEAAGANQSALDAYDVALRLVPDFAAALQNRRALLLLLGRVDEAVAQSRMAVARQPFSIVAQFSLGEALTAGGCFEEAAIVFARAVTLSPGDARVALHYGFALAQLERFSEAQIQLDRAVRIDSGMVREYRKSIFGEELGDVATASPHLEARTLFLLRHFDRIERCDWSERDVFIDHFCRMIENAHVSTLNERALAFRGLAMALDPSLQLKLARQISDAVESLLPDEMPRYSSRSGKTNSRIRVAYLSADFRYHPVALLLGNMFLWHDRSRFEVIGYSIGGDDGSEQRRRVIESCDEFVDLAGLDDESAARRIAADSIDVLVDLVGYLDRARPGILARRPAPVQISWLNYMATTGAPWIDYIVADAVSLPDYLASHFS